MGDRLQRIVALVIAYGLITLLGALVLHSYGVVWVSGGSMLPALVPGDVVVVAKGAERLQRGDIALLKPGDRLVLHRIVRTGADGTVWTRGDANPIADLNPTLMGAVEGRVVRVVPIGALLQRWRGGKSCDTLSAQSHSPRL